MKKISFYIIILSLILIVSGCRRHEPANSGTEMNIPESDSEMQTLTPTIGIEQGDFTGESDDSFISPVNDATNPLNFTGESDDSFISPVNDATNPLDFTGESGNSLISPVNDITNPLDFTGESGNSLISPVNDATETNSITPLPTKELIMIPDNENIRIDDNTDFSISPITDAIFSRIKGKSYPDGCSYDIENLRYLTILHYGFDDNIHVGEIIVNKSIASDALEIFEELYAIKYPIERLCLIDEYNADDEASMEDNNSSSFNYRFIAGTTVLSRHSLGLAIDINTLYNPYVYTRKDGSVFLQPENADDYIDRDKLCPYYIKHGDPCYEIFISHGFIWGGDWTTKKDYQHFEIPESN